jgi:hypothetical protein
MPDFVIWLASFFSPAMALLYPQLGVIRNTSSEKATCVGCRRESFGTTWVAEQLSAGPSMLLEAW